jgi:glutamate racemase
MAHIQKIGVFDSGLGGMSVARSIQKELPNYDVIFVNDKQNMPYGDKDSGQLLILVLPIIKKLVDEGCAVIIIACNTVTTTIIKELRTMINVPIIGIEPMIKVAAKHTKSKIIAVCATPATLNSKRYLWLKKTYAKDLLVIEPDCSNWAYMIESNNLNKYDIHDTINTICDQGADIIVLGCTHYHWIETQIRSIASKRAITIQPEQPVLRELKKILSIT